MVKRSNMMSKARGSARRPLAVALASSALLLIVLGQASAQADVIAVKGSAYGVACDVVGPNGDLCTTFINGNFTTPFTTPVPTVSLDSAALNSPQNASVTAARTSAGPATLFSSGAIGVNTQGSLGAGGSVTSSTNIANVNASTQEVFTASNLASTCTATEGAAATGSTTITSGTLQTDNGDFDSSNSIPNHPAVDVALPANPAPNTSIGGHIHIGNTTDNFSYVFNEQTVNADGSITVNAGHQYLKGPAAKGNLIVGQSVCGVTALPLPRRPT